MALTILDKFWHKQLGRPYYLARAVDEGSGSPVVLLHGIGRTAQVWNYVVEKLLPVGVRVVAFDLLGFGDSPKPTWIKYDADDHAKAVIASIEKLKLNEPVVLVGHSMGCLVAIRVARLRPDLVRHLVIFEMPLHHGLPEKRRYKVLNDLYFRLYKKIISLNPTFDPTNMTAFERVGRRVVGMEVTKENWFALVLSLENTIMNQTTADDIKEIDIPMDVIYGTWDMMVIRGKPQRFFGDDNSNIIGHKIRARHVISEKPSQFIVERIQAALGADGTETAVKSVVA
jgi:pimeloyl-ACP methyl ester carboxylesterase